MVQITIRVRPEAARGLRQRQATTPVTSELFRTAEDLGVELEPMHPQVSDINLASYYTAEVADIVAAEQAIARLQRCEAVEAAYIKPPDALP